jgi:hypothetical protein
MPYPMESQIRESAGITALPYATYSAAKRLLLISGLVVLALRSTWSHRSRWREFLPLSIFPIGLILGYIPFTVEAGRYALPVLPCLMVLSVPIPGGDMSSASVSASSAIFSRQAVNTVRSIIDHHGAGA